MEQRFKFKINVPSDILAIKDVFKKNGHKLYIVGGAVRDALLRKTPKDFDLATDALPDKVENMMAKAGFRTLPTGKAFGVINVFTDQDQYEIATFRIDDSGGRRPDSVTFTNIETDVKRRDLTINALFYDIDTQEVVDLVGGVNDLRNGVVRTVGKPEDRFDEDPLRKFRAIRFAGKFGTGLEPKTDAALKKDPRLTGFPVINGISKNVSPERIREEFLKGIKSAKSVKHYLDLIDSYGLFSEIFKGFIVRKMWTESRDPMIVIANLLVGNDVNKVKNQLNAMTYKVEEVRGITFLLNFLTLNLKTVLKLKNLQKISGLSDEQIQTFATFNKLSPQMVKAFLTFKLTVSGDEMMKQFNLKPGKEVGDAIEKAEFQNFLKLM